MSVFDIRMLTVDELRSEGFCNWLGRTKPELFREYLYPDEKARRYFLSARFEDLLKRSPSSEIRVGVRGKDYVAVMACEYQHWDHNHFGVRCGRLSPYSVSGEIADDAEVHSSMLQSGVDWARAAKVKVLQRRLLSNHRAEIAALEGMDFHLVDNVVTLGARLSSGFASVTRQGLSFRLPEQADRDDIVSITRGAFMLSRLVNDKVLPATAGNELYAKWIARLLDQALAGRGGDCDIIVAELDGRFAGYAAFQIERDTAAHIGKCLASLELIAVRRELRGKGTGQALISEVCRVARERGADWLESSTWMNDRGSMAANQKAGLRVYENIFTYHRWLEAEA